jgi:cysteine-rich repeat protein
MTAGRAHLGVFLPMLRLSISPAVLLSSLRASLVRGRSAPRPRAELLALLCLLGIATEAYAIENGVPTNGSEYPYIASLYFGASGCGFYQTFGGGALIAPNAVLTTATRLVDLPENISHFETATGCTGVELHVFISRTDINDPDAGYYTRSATSYTYHSAYDPATLANDVGIIILGGAVLPVSPIGLLSQAIVDGEPVRVLGYGLDQVGGTATDTLEYVDLDVALATQWSGGGPGGPYYPIESSVFTAQRDSFGVHQGDEGGPAIVNRSGTDVLAGIYSHPFGGVGLDLVPPGEYFDRVQGFTSIPAITPWIGQQLGVVCGNGVLEITETCDDGNTADGDGCSATCAAEEILPGVDYDDAFCQQVVGTLNIHWEDVTTPETPCNGIEFTDGTLLDAADGDVTMSGTSVSNPLCIGLGIYAFSVSPDGLTLTGTDTFSGVNMTLTRTPTQSCFTGHWVQAPYDFVAHIGAEVFGAEVAPSVPSLSPIVMSTLCSLLGLAGWWRLRIRHSRGLRSWLFPSPPRKRWLRDGPASPRKGPIC